MLRTYEILSRQMYFSVIMSLVQQSESDELTETQRGKLVNMGGCLVKEMATHSSVLAWRIPRTGEPGGLPSMGSHRVRHD